MKTSLLILSVAAIALFAGIVYADDLPYMNTKDIGTEIYEGAFGGKSVDEGILCAKDFGVPGKPVEQALVDVGSALYNDAFRGHDTMTRSAAGSEAGGLCLEQTIIDEPAAKVWDHIMGDPGGSDLP